LREYGPLASIGGSPIYRNLATIWIENLRPDANSLSLRK